MNKSIKNLLLTARKEISLLAIFILSFVLSGCSTHLCSPQIIPLDKPSPLSAETILENVINKYKSIDFYYSSGWYSKHGGAHPYPFVLAYSKPNKFVLMVGSSAIVANENEIFIFRGDKLFKRHTPYAPKEDLRNDELATFCGLTGGCDYMASDLSMLLSDSVQTYAGPSVFQKRLYKFKNGYTDGFKLFNLTLIGTSVLNNRTNYVLKLELEGSKPGWPGKEAYKIWIDKEAFLITCMVSSMTTTNGKIIDYIERYDMIDLAPQNKQLVFNSPDQCDIGEILYDMPCKETRTVFKGNKFTYADTEAEYYLYRLSFKELFYPSPKNFSDFKPASIMDLYYSR